MVAVLFNAGDHVPIMPLFDMVDKGLNVAPLQIGATAVNVGVILLLTTTVTLSMQLLIPLLTVT